MRKYRLIDKWFMTERTVEGNPSDEELLGQISGCMSDLWDGGFVVLDNLETFRITADGLVRLRAESALQGTDRQANESTNQGSDIPSGDTHHPSKNNVHQLSEH